MIDKYEEYEIRKKQLLWASRDVPRNITADEYKEECKKIAKELGI